MAGGEQGNVDHAGMGGSGCVGAEGRGVAPGVTPKPRFFYRAHGLVFGSAFAVPEIIELPAPAVPDVLILIDPEAEAVARRAARALPPGTPTDAEILPATPRDGGGVFTVEGLGSFWVREGREIRVAPLPGADPGFVALYILGSAIGLVLFQRGALVLHGAAVVAGAGATLFLGPSGAGKSTIAARLGQAGHPILGDDTLALWPLDDVGGFVVHPSGTSFKLWRDALEAAGLAAVAGAAVAERVEKFYLANPRRAEDRAHRVAEVLILAQAAPGEAPRIEPLPLLDAVREVGANVYRPQFARSFGGVEAEFRHTAALVGRVPVARLLRPWDHSATGAVVDLLDARWAHADPTERLAPAGRATAGARPAGAR